MGQPPLLRESIAIVGGIPVLLEKPVNKRCTSRWTEGVVTGIVSRNNVEVDGVPRHVLDIRRLVNNEGEEGRATSDTPSNLSSSRGATGADETGLRMFREDEEEDQPRENVEVVRPRRSARVRCPPVSVSYTHLTLPTNREV